MIKPFRQTVVLLLLVSCAVLGYGQQEGDRVREMFDGSSEVEWIRTLEGAVNDLHPIELALGFDGNIYKGEYRILDDDTSFDLIGEMDGNRLVLQEIDSKGLHTGYLIGVLENDRFTGQWWSTDMSRSTDIRLMESGLVVLKDFKPQMVTLNGVVGEELFDCILMIESTGAISGTWQRENECVRMLGRCEDMLCAKIELIISEGELEGVPVLLEFEDVESYRVDIKNGTIAQYGNVKVMDEVHLYRHAQSDYTSIIDFTYPEITDGKFNAWIDTKFLTWYDATLKIFAQNELSGPAGRWSQVASGWLDVLLCTDQIISGLITHYSPEDVNYKREYFIYSIDEERELTLVELSKKDRNLLKALQDKIHIDGVPSHEFIYPVLTRSGFFVCTEFDAVTGDYSAMVGYDEVDKIVKRKAFFTKLEE